MVTYNALLDAFGKAGQIERAWDCLRLMREDGLRPDVVTFTVLLNALGKAGQTERAWDCLRLMREDGLRPNVVTYNALLDAFGKAGQTERAWSLFSDMLAAGVEIDAITITTVGDAYYRAGEFDRGAANLLSVDLPHVGLRIVAAELLRKAQRYTRARMLCEAVLEQASLASEAHDQAWVILAYVCLHSDRAAFVRMCAEPSIDPSSRQWVRFLCARTFAQDPSLDRRATRNALQAALGETRGPASLEDIEAALAQL